MKVDLRGGEDLEVCDDKVPEGYWDMLIAWLNGLPTLEETDEEPPEPLI